MEGWDRSHHYFYGRAVESFQAYAGSGQWDSLVQALEMTQAKVSLGRALVMMRLELDG